MRIDETWHRLQTWTAGQAPSERLAAQVLLAEGFTGLDPSHPLGGPDGTKDATAERAGETWIMAAYFPRKPVAFRTLKRKLLLDAKGVGVSGAVGMAFVTNQEVSRSQRSDLESSVEHDLGLYHLEKLVAILDQPFMHPVRSQFLLIPVDGSGEDDDLWDGYWAPSMPAGWPKVWVPPKGTESYDEYVKDPDDEWWKLPRVCSCGEVFTEPPDHEDFLGSIGDVSRAGLDGAIPEWLEEDDLFNPIVWHWLNLLWDAGEAEGGESFSPFVSRENWFNDKRDRREFVQAMRRAQAEFDVAHGGEASGLRWRKPWE